MGDSDDEREFGGKRRDKFHTERRGGEEGPRGASGATLGSCPPGGS